jgi:hypothetical protein
MDVIDRRLRVPDLDQMRDVVLDDLRRHIRHWHLAESWNQVLMRRGAVRYVEIAVSGAGAAAPISGEPWVIWLTVGARSVTN